MEYAAGIDVSLEKRRLMAFVDANRANIVREAKLASRARP